MVDLYYKSTILEVSRPTNWGGLGGRMHVPGCPRGGLTPQQMLLRRARVDPPQPERWLLLLRRGGRAPPPGTNLLLQPCGGLTPPEVRPDATVLIFLLDGFVCFARCISTSS